MATDGNPVPPVARVEKNTIIVGPGERYDVIWTARKRGTWLLLCRILHHLANEDVEVEGGGGLTLAIHVT